MGTNQLVAVVEGFWDASVLDHLRRYIEIPAKSQEFDPQWYVHGYLAQAVELVRSWVRVHVPKAAIVERVDSYAIGSGIPRTPLLFIDIPATGGSGETVLMYGHLDKQPEFEGWDEERELEPWNAVDIIDARGHLLFGRGGADDGYAAFAAVSAIRALDELKIQRARCVMLIETGEESGSPDLPFYLDLLRERIGSPSLIVALDSGCGTYDRLWLTTTLRGVVIGKLDVQVLTEGVHSGDATGIVPDSFRFGRELIQLVEHAGTGEVRITELHAPIPEAVIVQARIAAEAMGIGNITRFPWVEGTCPKSTDPLWLMEQVLNRTWRPGLTITGIDGMPSVKDGGNVRRPGTSFKLSMRIPPSVDANEAARHMERVIMDAAKTMPAKITFSAEGHAAWMAPPEAEWLSRAVDEASLDVYGKKAVRMGEGGSIPFMGLLYRAYPDAQFVITGVLGPESNAHGPNEFLNVGYAERLSAAIACIMASHAQHFASANTK